MSFHHVPRFYRRTLIARIGPSDDLALALAPLWDHEKSDGYERSTSCKLVLAFSLRL